MTDAGRGDAEDPLVGGWVSHIDSRHDMGSALDAVTVPLPVIRATPPRRPDRRGELVVVGGVWREEAGEHGPYRGRRRATRPLGVAAAAMLVGAAVVIAAPMMIGSPPPPAEYSSAWESEPGPVPSEDPDALAASSAPAHSRRPSSTPSPSTVASAAPSAESFAAGPFAPLTLEAEEAWWSGSATRDRAACAPDVQIVRLIGDWTTTAPDNDGIVVFRRPPPAGAYTMTVHYVITKDPSRTAQIRFVGPNPVTITETFKAAPCMTSKAVSVTIPEGTTSIEFGNSTSRAPSIDKIVFSR